MLRKLTRRRTSLARNCFDTAKASSRVSSASAVRPNSRCSRPSLLSRLQRSRSLGPSSRSAGGSRLSGARGATRSGSTGCVASRAAQPVPVDRAKPISSASHTPRAPAARRPCEDESESGSECSAMACNGSSRMGRDLKPFRCGRRSALPDPRPTLSIGRSSVCVQCCARGTCRGVVHGLHFADGRPARISSSLRISSSSPSTSTSVPA